MVAASRAGKPLSNGGVALTASGKPKEKRRNNEKRKEKSRDAARCRRSRETEIFTELGQVLPLKKEDVSQLDKASIMRIAIAYLKVRDMLQLFPKIQAQTKENEAIKADDNDDDDLLKCAEASQLMKQTLDGFLIVLSDDGDITYISDNIVDYLGLAKIDILGQQIWEYLHQCDHAELKEALNIKRNGIADKIKSDQYLEDGLLTDNRDLFVRFKCTITSRGRSINIKSASYKVIHLTGHLVANEKGNRALVAVGRPIPHPSNVETPLSSTTFMTKHSLNMKFTYVDEKMREILGYEAGDLIDTSLFECQHGSDTESLMATFKTVFSKGQGETQRYRFLGKYGGYCWVVTQATVIYDKMKPQSLVCVNFLISNLENDHEIYSLAQYEASQKRIKIEDNNNNNKENNNINNNNNNNSNNNNTNKNILKPVINVNDVDLPIKEQQQQNINQQKQQQTINKANTSTTTKIIDNNPPKTTTPTPTAVPNPTTTSATLNHIKLSPPTTAIITPIKQLPPTATVTSKLFKSNKSLSSSTSSSSSILSSSSSPRPKSVTASVFRAVPAGILPNILTKNSNNNSNSNNSNNNFNNKNSLINKLPTNVALAAAAPNSPTSTSTRAQSVTASVFTPISNFISKSSSQQQNTPNTVDNNKNNNNLKATTTKTSTATILAQRQLQRHQQQQQQQQRKEDVEAALLSKREKCIEEELQVQEQQQQSPKKNKKDMNKGFLTFVDDASSNELTMLKEEPDDLAHLAPSSAAVTANVDVDACMPLDETTPLFGEMLVGLMGSYGSLLPDDINSLDSQASAASSSSSSSSSIAAAAATIANETTDTLAATAATEAIKTSTTLTSNKQNCNNSNYHNNNNNISETNTTTRTTTEQTTTETLSLSLSSSAALDGNHNHKAGVGVGVGATNVAHIDPFINYREESNDTNCSQHLLSPSVTSTSPEASSLPSLCSPNSLSQEDEFAFMTMNVDDDIDLTMRAPYIPMNEQDDLPLLTADDLMWCSSNPFNTDDIQMQKDIADVMQQQYQQLQQIQATCDVNPHLRNNLLDFNNQQQQLQQSHQTQHHQQQLHLNNNFVSNSLCSSPASTISSLSSPSPVGCGGNLQQQQQQDQTAATTTNVFGTTDTSELAALLCGTGNGTLTILSGVGGGGCNNNCNDDATNDCHGITVGVNTENLVGGASNNVNNNGGGVGNVVNIVGNHFRQQLLIDDDGLQQQQQRQQQQQQQQLLVGGLNIICKKEKFSENASSSLSLCDSIENAFEHVYNKDSTNLDCWNEFLPINAADPITTTVATIATANGGQQQQPPHSPLDLNEYQTNENCRQQHQQQQQQQQQQLLNAVPLITIQNNKNIILQQQQQLQDLLPAGIIISNNNSNNNNNKIIVNDEMLSSLSSAKNNHNRNNSKLATIKLINGTKQQQQQRNQTVTKTTIIQTIAAAAAAAAPHQQQQQHGNKRHMNSNVNSLQFENKRLKSGLGNGNLTVDDLQQQATPQLLQQLIAPLQQQQQQLPLTIKIETKPQQQQQQPQILRLNKLNNNNNQRWSSPTSNADEDLKHKQQQQSDSVLKNLLISGCDNIETPEAIPQVEPMYTDENSMDTNEEGPASPFSTSSLISPSHKPLRCLTSTASVLRNFRHNPMIGGTGILPSPTLLHNDNEDSNTLPELITVTNNNNYNDIGDASSDSGIGEVTQMDADVQMKITKPQIVLQQQQQQDGDLLLMKVNKKIEKKTIDLNSSNNHNHNNNNTNPLIDKIEDERHLKRKTSISFMDSSNPLLTTPFLMDLCNDDYNMNATEFLQENDIESVLNQWSHELV